MVSKRDIEIICNSLANIYDWDSENLENDFILFIKSEIPHLERDRIEKIINDFERLPAEQKNSINFNYREFVESCLDI